MSAVPTRRPSTVKLPQQVFEIHAVDGQAQTLLELITHLNGQLDLAKSLRRQKSGVLTEEEKKYVDEAFQRTESSMRQVATLLEPCRPATDASGDAMLHTELMFTLRDSPRIQLTLTSLGMASQTLNTVAGILFGREGADHTPLRRSYSTESPPPPPSYEESTLLRSRGESLNRRTGSIREVEESGDQAGPGANQRSTYSGYPHPPLKPGREAPNVTPEVANGMEETARIMSEIPRETTSFMSSAARVPTGGLSRVRDGSTSMTASALSTEPAPANVPRSINPLSAAISTSPTGISELPTNVSNSGSQLRANPTSANVQVSQPLPQPPSSEDTEAPQKPAPLKPRKPSSAVNPTSLHQAQTHPSSQRPSLPEQGNLRADQNNVRATKRESLPSQVRERSRQNESVYVAMPTLGEDPRTSSQSGTPQNISDVVPDATSVGRSPQGLNIHLPISAQSGGPPRTTPMRPPVKPSAHARRPQQHQIPRKRLPSEGAKIAIPPQRSSGLDSAYPEVVPTPSVPPAKAFIEFMPDAAPELSVHRSPESAPEVACDSAPEIAAHDGNVTSLNRTMSRTAPEPVPSAPQPPMPLPSAPQPSMPLPSAPQPSMPLPPSPQPSSPLPSSPLPSSPRSDTSNSASAEVWNASMARRRPRRTRPDSHSEEVSRVQPATASNSARTSIISGGSSPRITRLSPLLTSNLAPLDSSLHFENMTVGQARERRESDVLSIRSVTSTRSSTGGSALTGKARGQRWREAQYEKFENL